MSELKVLDAPPDKFEIRKGKPGVYKVNEIFYSIQGEGLFTGCPMIFIRLAKCNLRCSWCDTEFDTYTDMTVDDLLAECVRLAPGKRPRVCFTGGEPSLQIDRVLVEEFSKLYYPLHIETNGMFPITDFHRFENITVSPKLPLSRIKNGTVVSKYWGGMIAVPDTSLTLKIVYDLTPGFNFHEIRLDWQDVVQWTRRYLQPLCNNDDGSTNVADLLPFIYQNPQWCLSQQTHKLLGLR